MNEKKFSVKMISELQTVGCVVVGDPLKIQNREHVEGGFEYAPFVYKFSF